jgi:5-methylcytosine-specific restriction protein A
VKLQRLQPRLATLNIGRVQELKGTGWRAGKTTSERGYSYKWQKARERHLAAHPLCVMCEAEGRVTAASVVDHRVPHRGDRALFWDESNWDSLCANHHSRDKQRQERAAE